MKSLNSLDANQRRTYEAILNTPTHTSPRWRDLRAFLEEVTQIDEQPGRGMTVTRNGVSLELQPGQNGDPCDHWTLFRLRHFLNISKEAPSTHGPWLLVIDHHEARLFRSLEHPHHSETIHPEQSEASISKTQAFSSFSRGKEKPNEPTYFGPLGDLLKDAGELILLGRGKGTGNEMEQFQDWIAHHRPELSAHIIGTFVLDERHLTDAQLLASARDLYAGLKHSITQAS